MSAERFTLDTNILVYAADRRDPARHTLALEIIVHARGADCVLTLQSLTEYYAVVTRKALVNPRDAEKDVAEYAAMFPVSHVGPAILREAIASSIGTKLSIWDALLLETAREAGCRYVLSEDMADGRSYRGLTVLNPFAPGGMPAAVRRLLQMA